MFGHIHGALYPALAVAIVLLSACGKAEEPKKAEPDPVVTVAAVEQRPLTNALSASGVLISREEAGVSPELSGYRIAQVLVEEGAWVARGQPLAQLDDTLLKAQIDQQVATVAQQEATAERAEADAARVQGLDNKGVLSNEAIAERRFSAKSARAAVEVAKAGLQDLRTRQSRMTIRAPVAGRVLERTARPGDTSAPGTTLFRIARDGLVELDAEVPETDLARLKIGQGADVTIPSGATVHGTIRLISPRVDPQTKLGRVRVALPVRPDLRPGGFGRVSFGGAGTPVLVAPEGAVRYTADGASVMVVQPDNRVRQVTVRTGQRSGGYVELVEGPPAGSRLALGGAAFVLNGDKVRVGAAAPAAQPAAAR